MKIKLKVKDGFMNIFVDGINYGILKRCSKTKIFQPHWEGDISDQNGNHHEICEITTKDVKIKLKEIFNV